MGKSTIEYPNKINKNSKGNYTSVNGLKMYSVRAKCLARSCRCLQKTGRSLSSICRLTGGLPISTGRSAERTALFTRLGDLVRQDYD